MNEPPRTQISTWQVAEANAREWMRFWGFRDARLTPSGADGGVDVIASEAVAQVKFEAKQVGRPQLQTLVGARGRNTRASMLFFSGAGYTVSALEYAIEMEIALFHYALDGQMRPINATATMIMREAVEEPQIQLPAVFGVIVGAAGSLLGTFGIIGIVGQIFRPTEGTFEGLPSVIIFALIAFLVLLIFVKSGGLMRRSYRKLKGSTTGLEQGKADGGAEV